MAETPSRSTRSTLLGRVKDWQDHQSWALFFRQYHSLIYSFGIRAGLTRDEAQDVTQEILIEIAEQMKTFTYDRQHGSFKAWLLRLASWRIADRFQKRSNGVRCERISQSLFDRECSGFSLAHTELDDAWEQEWRNYMLTAALDKLRRQMKRKHFQVLHSIVRNGWSVSEITRTFRMNRGHVYLIKFKGLAQLREQIARLEQGQR